MPNQKLMLTDIMIFTLFFTILPIVLAQNDRSPVVKRAPCDLSLYIQNCKNLPDHKITKPISKRSAYIFTANLTKSESCNIRIKDSTWSLNDIDLGSSDYEKYEFVPWLLENNLDQKIEVMVNGDNSGTFFNKQASCKFDVRPEKPTPVIVGGKERRVPPEQLFTMDGTTSVDNDQRPTSPAQLKFEWSCKRTKGDSDDLCADIGNNFWTVNYFEVGGNLVHPGHIYEFTMKVRAWGKLAENDWVMAKQKVIVGDEADHTDRILMVECLKNCPPSVNPNEIVYLHVVCIDCDPSTAFEWSIDADGFDYDKSTQFGRNSDKFIVLANRLDAGRTYKVVVKTKTESGDYVLDVPAALSIKSCTVTPSDGTALETEFRLSCDISGSVATYAIYTKSNEKTVSVAKGPNLADLKFKLPINAEAYLKITGDNTLTSTRRLTVSVKPFLEASWDLPDKAGNMIDIAARLDGQEMIATLNAVTEELQKDKTLLNQNDNRAKIFDKIDDIPLDGLSRDELLSMVGIVNRLNDNNDQGSNPKIGATTAKVCRKAAEANLDYTKHRKDPTTGSNDTKKAIKALMSCPEHNVKENVPLLENKADFHITTAYPVLMEEQAMVQTEDYPEYPDDNSTERRRMYQKATDSFVDICVANVKTVVLTVIPGEQMVSVLTKSCGVAVMKDFGYIIANQTISFNGILIKPSQDFKNKTNVIDVLLCTWEEPLYWWKASSSVILSKVAFLSFAENGSNIIRQFKQPFKLGFDIKEHHFKMITAEFPSNEFKTDDDILVIRVEVLKWQHFWVEFPQIDGDFYRVAFSDFRKIGLNEFQNRAMKISSVTGKFFVEHAHDYDGWHYISIIQNHRGEISSFKKNINLNVYTMTCASWNNSELAWNPTCEGQKSTSMQHIACSCTHLSILAGIAYDNPVKIDTWVIKSDFVMFIAFSPIVLISILVLLTLYGLLLFLVFYKEKISGYRIFTVGDLHKLDEYHYVVQVRTGTKPNSGTSSNICIRIYGTRGRSKSHLLNYPDPEKLILQRGCTDWFVVTTGRSLGGIVRIALWGDCTGRRPFWHCKDVTIYDMEVNKKWYFPIEAWIKLPPEGKVLLRSKPVVEKKKNVWKILSWIKFGWKIKMLTDLGVVRSATIFLSSYLLIYFLTMLLYGMPRLQSNDIFQNYTEFYLNYFMFLSGILSSFMSFLVHIGLIYILRTRLENSEKFEFLSMFSWGFILFNITTTLSILLVFGVWLPELTACYWLFSTIEGLILFFIYLRIASEIYLNLFEEESKPFFLHLDLYHQLKRLLQLIDHKLNSLYDTFGDTGLRPYTRHLYKLIEPKDMESKRKYYETRKKLMLLLEDLLMFGVYITLLYLSIFAGHNDLTVTGYNEMTDLVQGSLEHTHNLDGVATIPDFYNYLNETIIYLMQSPQWYGRFVVKDPGLTVDFNNKYLGVARLRQLRSIPKPCKLPHSMAAFYAPNVTCVSEYQSTDGHIDMFGGEQYHTDRQASIWNYTKASKAGYSLVVGEFGMYPGGGYVATLGRTMYNSYVSLNYLKKTHWLDKYTRVVFIEFLTFCPNSNLFSSVRIGFERSVTGCVWHSNNVKTRKILYRRSEKNKITSLIYICFVVIVVILTVKIFARWFQVRSLFYLKDLWTLVDFFIISMSYATFVVFIHRTQLVQDFIRKTEGAKKNEFINYFPIFDENFLFEILTALLVFVATVRLWKLARFGRRFKVMEETIRLAITPILVIFIYHAIFLFSFTMSGNVLLGDLDDFKSKKRSLITLAIYGVGMSTTWEPRELPYIIPIFGAAFYAIYMIASLIIMLMYEVVLMSCYYQATLLFADDNEFELVTSYVKNEANFFIRLLRLRLRRLRRGGAETKKNDVRFVTPNEERYANCTTIPKVQLELIKTIVEYRLATQQLSATVRFKVMAKIAALWLTEKDGLPDDENEMFFLVKAPNQKIKIVSNATMVRMEEIVEMICNKQFRLGLFKKSFRKLNMIIRKTKAIAALVKTLKRIFSNIIVKNI